MKAQADYFSEMKRLLLTGYGVVQLTAAYVYVFAILYMCNEVIAVRDIYYLQQVVNADYQQLGACLANSS
jgi:hypothetical protein